jgi:hypothetical protein
MNVRDWIGMAAGLLLIGTTSSGQAQKPTFHSDAATLRVGLDDRVYVSAEGLVLRCGRDGSDPAGAPAGGLIANATASPEGIIAVAHAHFSKDVTLYDGDFDVLGRFSRIADAGFRSPGGVAAGLSGDFYALDQGRDCIVRFHPDGIRCGIYQIPREPDGPAGELVRFRVCEKTKTLYVVDRAPVVRCLSMEGSEWKQTCRKLWEAGSEGALAAGSSLYWGYGGFDVDENGILYIVGKTGTVLKRFDPAGRPLPDAPLEWGDLKPTEKEFIRDIQVSKGEVFVKRSHATELFQRYDLATGRRKNVVPAPAEYSALVRDRKGSNGVRPLKAVVSPVGIPSGRGTPLRVLFIGNSQINCIRDIPEIVEELSRSDKSRSIPLILAEEVAVGGVGLEGYWKEGLALKRIAAGGWDWIVINEIVYSFGASSARYQEYARKFAAEAKKAGARTLFFATAEVENAKARQEVMYRDAVAMARESGGRVAGGGMAWPKAWARRPMFDFYHTDRAHPNAQGYYLNACVIFSALTGGSPEGLHPAGLGEEEAGFLQKIAWEQSLEDRKEESK